MLQLKLFVVRKLSDLDGFQLTRQALHVNPWWSAIKLEVFESRQRLSIRGGDGARRWHICFWGGHTLRSFSLYFYWSSWPRLVCKCAFCKAGSKIGMALNLNDMVEFDQQGLRNVRSFDIEKISKTCIGLGFESCWCKIMSLHEFWSFFEDVIKRCVSVVRICTLTIRLRSVIFVGLFVVRERWQGSLRRHIDDENK